MKDHLQEQLCEIVSEVLLLPFLLRANKRC